MVRDGATLAPASYIGVCDPLGDFVSDIGGAKCTPSSLRYKNNVQSLGGDFSRILLAEPRSFTYKDSGKADIGYIAEEIDALGLKDFVVYDAQGRPDALKYDRIPMYTLEVVKAQQKTIETLEARISALESR